jgi:hypothetical protein
MGCFNGSRAHFFVRILALLQLAAHSTFLAVASYGLASAWQDRNKKNDNNDDNGSHHCECVLKTRPLSCDLIENSTKDINFYDPLFIIICFWLAAISFLCILKDLRFGASRLTNFLVFLFNGSVLLGLGDHFDLTEFSYFGMFAGIFALLLLFSVPICGRMKNEFEGDEHSRLTDNDEFGQANGVFSSLE